MLQLTFVTTLPAPMTQPDPILTPHSMLTPAAIQHSSPISMLEAYEGAPMGDIRSSASRGQGALAPFSDTAGAKAMQSSVAQRIHPARKAHTRSHSISDRESGKVLTQRMFHCREDHIRAE